MAAGDAAGAVVAVGNAAGAAAAVGDAALCSVDNATGAVASGNTVAAAVSRDPAGAAGDRSVTLPGGLFIGRALALGRGDGGETESMMLMDR